MLDMAKVTHLMQELNANIPFLSEINSSDEHQEALDLIEVLLEDYDRNLALIEILTLAIERYEERAPEFADFNNAQVKLDSDITLLRVLMDQHNLKASDLENEIGKKSLVSQILHGKKNLTKKHIAALSQRFNLSPALFFPQN